MASGADADLVDAFTWVSKKDYERAKEKAFAFSSTITAVKADITLLKAEFSGLALLSVGANFAKFDFSLLKVDEKGVTWRGKQIYATKWADEAKHYQVRLERAQEQAAEELGGRIKRLEAAQSSQVEKKGKLDRAETGLLSARSLASRPGTTEDDFTELARSGSEREQAKRDYEKAEKRAKNLENRLAGALGKYHDLNEEIERLDDKMKTAKDRAADEYATEKDKLDAFKAALNAAAHAA